MFYVILQDRRDVALLLRGWMGNTVQDSSKLQVVALVALLFEFDTFL